MCTSWCVTSCAHTSRKTYLWVAASAPPLPAVEQPRVVQQSSEFGLAAAAAAAVRPKLQGPEMRQQETRRRLAFEELEQTLRFLREQPEVLDQCPVARITLLAEAEEASKLGPAGLQQPAAYLPPAAEEKESSTKTYGVPLLMSESFYSLLDSTNKYRCRKVDQLIYLGPENDSLTDPREILDTGEKMSIVSEVCSTTISSLLAC